MEARVVSQTIAVGRQRWRLNADGTWSVLMFGSFGPEQIGLCHRWMPVPPDKVPDKVRVAIR